jgi:hypothetical protein
MKYEIAFICIAVLMAMPMVQGLEVGIDPGESHLVMANLSFDVNVSCSECENITCPDCEDCGTCTIEKELSPGEHFEKQEGTCDIDMYCNYEETAEKVEKNYTFRMKLNKHDGDDIYLGLEVMDFLGTIVDSETYDWSRDSIVTITEDFSFTCPTKVIFDSVNADTCAGYFEDYYTDKDPMSMMLAKDMSVYRDRFLECVDNKSEIEWQISHYKELYTNCGVIQQNAISDMQTMNDTYYDMKATVDARVTQAVRGSVPGWWMWLAIVFIIAFSMSVILQVFGGEW